jgi:hypothetical protein
MVLGINKTLIGRDGVAALSIEFAGELLRPGDSGFDVAASIWNGAVEGRPALIARCRSRDDVAAVVRFAACNDVLVAVKGGGHNVAGFATCDGGIVIDLSLMDEVTVDPEARLARVGGGATWARVDAATQPHGLAAPGGLVSKTGVAGLTLGGGLSWLRRKYGLSCDNLVSVEIVTADGEIRTASETENPDLLWGVRGGGGNFGIVTRFDYRIHPVGPEVMFCFVLYPLEDGRSILRGWREFCGRAPDEASSIVLCGTVPDEPPFPDDVHGRQFVALATVHAGPVEEGQRILQPLHDLGEPLCDLSGPAPYIDVQSAFDGDYPDGRRYYWKSLYLESLDDDAIDIVLDLAEERPSSLSTVDIWQLGGAMGRVAPGATAFGDRSAPWLLGIESNWKDPRADEVNKSWTRQACTRMQPFSNGASYLNFEPDTRVEPVAESIHRHRLADLKRRYDPANLFRLNHNIDPHEFDVVRS